MEWSGRRGEGVRKVSRRGGTHWGLGGMISRLSSTNSRLGGRGTWSRLLDKALAKAFPFQLARDSLKSTGLGLGRCVSLCWLVTRRRRKIGQCRNHVSELST